MFTSLDDALWPRHTNVAIMISNCSRGYTLQKTLQEGTLMQHSTVFRVFAPAKFMSYQGALAALILLCMPTYALAQNTLPSDVAQKLVYQAAPTSTALPAPTTPTTATNPTIPDLPAANQSPVLRIVATTAMVGDIATRVGGSRVIVTTLMGEGVDPHLYKASARDVRLLQDANLILYSGLHLEGRMADVLVRLARKKPTVQVTDTIPEDRLREPPEFAGHFDPHVWFDPDLWQFTITRTRDALIELDPASKDLYSANADAYIFEFAEFKKWATAELSRIPKDRRVLVTAHDAFGYFGQAFDLEVNSLQGISTESEISIQGVNTLVDMLVQRTIPAVFVESSVPRKTIESLVAGAKARGHNVIIGGQLFSDAMGAPNTPEGTYLGMFRHNVSTIVKALAPADADSQIEILNPTQPQPVLPSPAEPIKPETPQEPANTSSNLSPKSDPSLIHPAPPSQSRKQ